MGRGSSTREVNVRKHLPTLQSQGSGTGGYGGGTQDNNLESNSCLFSFTLEIDIKEDLLQKLHIGDKSAIVPNGNGLLILVSGFSLGSYTGKYQKKITQCLQQNFVYEGGVEKIEVNKIQIHIQGHKR